MDELLVFIVSQNSFIECWPVKGNSNFLLVLSFTLEFYSVHIELFKKVHILHVNTHLWEHKWLRSFLFVLKALRCLTLTKWSPRELSSPIYSTIPIVSMVYSNWNFEISLIKELEVLSYFHWNALKVHKCIKLLRYVACPCLT